MMCNTLCDTFNSRFLKKYTNFKNYYLPCTTSMQIGQRYLQSGSYSHRHGIFALITNLYKLFILNNWFYFSYLDQIVFERLSAVLYSITWCGLDLSGCFSSWITSARSPQNRQLISKLNEFSVLKKKLGCHFEKIKIIKNHLLSLFEGGSGLSTFALFNHCIIVSFDVYSL